MIQHAGHVLQAELFRFHQEEDGARVERAGTGAHHQAVEHREAHGGGLALQVLHGAQAGAAAQVGHDDLALGDVAIELGQ